MPKTTTHLQFLFIGFLLIILPLYLQAQDGIEKHRKGELVILGVPGENVKIEQLSHEFWFGAAISNGLVSGSMSAEDKRQYEEKFLKNFNSAVTENALKWGNMEPKKGEVTYAVVDGILEWTDKHNIPLRGHNIYWGIEKFVQDWVKELDDEELLKTLQNRAEDIATKYKGRFVQYDLNNEMIHGNFYEKRLGPDITKKMVEWVHEKDPDAKLFLNDYDILTGNRLDDYMSHIRELFGLGVKIAGIGVQGHLHGERFDRAALKRSLDSLAVFKLPIVVTEFNMPGQRSKYYRENIQMMTPEEEAQKAVDLVDYYSICFAHPAVDGILMWGFWAGANWIPAASLYNLDWSPTPAADAYQDLIYKTWWTDASGTISQNGNFETTGFYGTYKITVGSETREVVLSKNRGRVVVDFR